MAQPKAAPAPEAAQADGGKRRADRKASGQSRQQLANKSRPLRNEVQGIDQRMEMLAKERAQIEASLVAGSLSGPDMAEAGRRLNHIAAEVAQLEERWLALHDQIEALNAAGE